MGSVLDVRFSEVPEIFLKNLCYVQMFTNKDSFFVHFVS